MITYIYIYCHPQTDCFVLSELFSVARHVECSKLGSKSIHLYVRLSIRPLGQQAYRVDYGNYEVLYSNSCSSVCLFTFLYPIGYQSAQFFRRVLHYASGRKFLRQNAQPPRRNVYIYIYIYIYWKFDQSSWIKGNIFQATVVSVLLYGCTTLTLTNRIEKKLDGNWTRMLWTRLNKSWKEHSTKQVRTHLSAHS